MEGGAKQHLKPFDEEVIEERLHSRLSSGGRRG